MQKQNANPPPAQCEQAADGHELSQDMAAELRDYLEWLLQRRGLMPRTDPGQDAADKGKGND